MKINSKLSLSLSLIASLALAACGGGGLAVYRQQDHGPACRKLRIHSLLNRVEGNLFLGKEAGALDAWTSLLSARIAVSEEIARTLPYKSEYVPNFVALPNDSTPRKPSA